MSESDDAMLRAAVEVGRLRVKRWEDSLIAPSGHADDYVPEAIHNLNRALRSDDPSFRAMHLARAGGLICTAKENLGPTTLNRDYADPGSTDNELIRRTIRWCSFSLTADNRETAAGDLHLAKGCLRFLWERTE